MQMIVWNACSNCISYPHNASVPCNCYITDCNLVRTYKSNCSEIVNSFKIIFRCTYPSFHLLCPQACTFEPAFFLTRLLRDSFLCPSHRALYQSDRGLHIQNSGHLKYLLFQTSISEGEEILDKGHKSQFAPNVSAVSATYGTLCS